MKRNIERIINELQHDSKIQAMHRANVAKRQAARAARRAAMLARHHKAVMVYDDREAKKAAIREGINQKFNGSGMIARVHYLARGREVVEKDVEFTDLYSEVCDELDDQYFKDIDARINNLLGHDKQPNDYEAKKAAIKKAIWEKYDGSTLEARLMFLVEIVQGKYNEEFKELLDEACHEIDAEKAEIRAEKAAKERREELEKLHKWCESKAEKLARLTGEDKATIIDRLERGLAA